MPGGAGTYRDDAGNLVINEAAADHLAERMANRFHTVAQKLKGGVLQNAQGVPGPDPVVANQWGGKGIIKFNPTDNEIQAGIKQQISLFTWQSPDGLPKYVTVEVGRLCGGVGGPGSDGTTGGLVVVNPSNGIGQGSIGGGTFPAGRDAAGNPLYYRASAQILIGTPGTMQDPFFIDINRGQRFTALASYVAVTAQMNGPPIDEQTGAVVIPSNNTLPYRSGSLAVYATLGAAVAPTLSPVLYTQYIDKGATAPFAATRIIPPRANFLLPFVTSDLGAASVGAFFFTFFDNTGAVIDQFVAESAKVPNAIPADCYGITVVSVANQPPAYRLIYQLSV